MENVRKSFPGTLAVDEVDFEVYPGEVHALIGENGAGKSTMMKMMAGSFSDYEGTIRIGGRPVDVHTPAVAKAYGVGMVYQEGSLARSISIAENLLAGRLPCSPAGLIDRDALISEARSIMERVGLEKLDPLQLVEELPRHEAQLVEIARVLGNEPDVLVMDEPTSSLSREEIDRLFDLIDRLRGEGLAIIYISHHLPEVFRVADRVTVLRDGQKVSTDGIDEVTEQELVRRMVGRDVQEYYGDAGAATGPEKLRVENLNRYGFFRDVSFRVRGGEVVGLAGLSGSGRTDLARSICGLDPVDDGHVMIRDEEGIPSSYPEALRKGIAYLTEDRKENGLFLDKSLKENLVAGTLGNYCRLGFYSNWKTIEPVKMQIDQLSIVPPESARQMNQFSGGNQQKALLGKWLMADPDVLVLNQPTRGVDVGAKEFLHQKILELVEHGKAIVLISSDLPEFVQLCDRAVVMRHGRLLGHLPGDLMSEESVLLASNGKEEILE